MSSATAFAVSIEFDNQSATTDPGFTYDVNGTPNLVVNASVVGSTGLPGFAAGSKVILNASNGDGLTSAPAVNFADLISFDFDTSAGIDIRVVSGDNATTYLQGNFIDLDFSGFNGVMFGQLTGTFSVLGGVAGGLYGGFFSDPSEVFSISLTLSQVLDDSAFAGAFSGSVDGFIRSLGEVPVPEPTSLALIGLGLCGFAKVRKTTIQA
ncbi:MAG: PEP-CTERM sorting domain-containing protein [Pseudomonadota bacterium]